MNKQRKTSNILNVFQYDADGHVVLPASLTLTIAPGSEDNNSKVPTTAWVRALISSLGYVTLASDQTITGLKTIVRVGASVDVLNFKIGTDTIYGLKVAYNQNELVESGEATWSLVNTFNRNGTGFSVTPVSFFRGVLVTGERLLSASVNANLLDYYSNNPSGRYPVYAYNTGVQQFSTGIIVGKTTGVVNAATGAISDLPSGVVANFGGRVIGSNAVNSNEFVTLTQLNSYVPTSRTLTINGTTFDLSANRTWTIPAGVTSFNTRTGAITLSSGDVTGALGYTPYNSSNPNGYISSYTETDTLASVTGRGATTSSIVTFTSTTSSASVIVRNDGSGESWRGRVGHFNATADKSVWLASYNGFAVVGAHNNALTAWADLLVNCVDNSGSGGTVRLAASAFVGSNAILHAGNYNSYSPTLTGSGASGTWGISITGNATYSLNSTRLYASDAPYTYGGASPYYMTMTYDGSRWLLQVTPGTPAAVRVSYADSSGSISGFNNPTTSATANTIVYRDGSGHITGNYGFYSYINTTDDISTGTISYIVAKFGDNYYRSATASKVQSFLGLGSAAYQNTGAFLSSSGNVTIGGYLTVTGAGTASSIYMSDSDEGNREIHCNSNRIGFLTQSSAWGAYCEDGGSWVSVADIRGADVYTTGGWFRNHTNNNGIYWSGTGWHLMPFNGSDFRMHSGSSSDASLRMETNGTTRGYMYVNNSNEIGFLNQDRSWRFRVTSGGDANVTATVYAAGYRGNANVGGTGEATWHPAGIYSGSTQWLYGTTYRNNATTFGQGNLYFDGNYGYGMIGLYSSTRYQGVFAMGDAYKLPVDGSGPSNLYGITWSHPNAGGVAGNLNTHGALILENGTFLAALSGSIRARDDMRAPIFYDSNNTGYYVDPSSASRIANIRADYIGVGQDINTGYRIITSGDYYANAGGNYWAEGRFKQYRGSGTWHDVVDVGNISSYTSGNTNSISSAVGGSYSWTGSNYFRSNRNTTSSDPPLQAYSNDSGGAIMSFHRGGYYAVNFGLDSDNVMRIGGWSASANRWQLDMSGNNWVAGSSRAPIFYDSDNTGYYLDPNGGSYFAGSLEIANGYFLSNGVGGSIRMSSAAGSFGGYFQFGQHAVIETIVGGYHVYVLSSNGNGVVKYDGAQSWSAHSDRRIKTIHSLMENNLSKLESINPIYYSFNNFVDDRNRIGLVAQEVQEHFPELVTIDPKTDYLTLDYTGLIPVLLGAIKELKNKVEVLESQL